MAKQLHFSSEYQQEFYKKFLTLCTSRMAWEVWLDIITLYATMIANAFDQQGAVHDNREEEYKKIIARYTKPEQTIISELFSILVHALEVNPEQDFFGEMFMKLSLSNHWKGQFFTPYYVSKAIAKMNIKDTETIISEHGWISVCDPACGAGALLIATRNEYAIQGFGFGSTLYIGVDIDRLAAMMCYIQLSLLGCAGYVVVANTLLDPPTSIGGNPLLFATDPAHEVWIMPFLYTNIWIERIMISRIKLALGNAEHIKDPTTVAPDKTHKIPTT